MGKKYAVNKKFFDRWSRPMAYVLGYIYADGSLENASYIRGYYTRITSTDHSTIINFKKILNSEHKIVNIAPRTQNSKIRYMLRIGDSDLYKALIRRGVAPNKSLSMTLPTIPVTYLSDFLRGYFDGDGCVYIYESMGKKKTRIMRGLSTIFTSGSKKFLSKLALRLAERLDLIQKKVYSSHRSFQLRYTTADSVKLFAFMYKGRPKIFLKRKAEKYMLYFSKAPKRLTPKLKKTIKHLMATW